MSALSLFSGIGGLELGLGCETVCYVESDPYAAAVLQARMEEGALGKALVYADDVQRFDAAAWRGVELVTAGFPCQPASVAGSRKGTDDTRWLWPEVVRVIAACRPRAVFLENVPGLLSVESGWPFHGILRDLASLGFVGRYDLFRADQVGAPHRRERWFCLAVDDSRRAEWRPWDESRHERDGYDSGREETAGRTREPSALEMDDSDEWERLRNEPGAGWRGDAEQRRGQAHDDMGAERVPDSRERPLRQLAERGEGSARQAEPGDAEPRHMGEAVDHGIGDRSQGKLEAGAASGAVIRSRGAEVGDSDSRRREGKRIEEHGELEGARRDLALGHGDDGRLPWPPGPKDREGWERWLERGGPAPAVGGRLNPAFVESLMGLPTGWTDLGYGDAARRERLRCLGNAVVPAQAGFAYQTLSTVEE